MRPGQNRRMRGRPRNKGPNPLTRTYESNGPDVKIRGTAQHVADKYAQLARDAQASGDPVAAENYFQHAEHYYRLIAAVQEQYRQQFGGTQRPFDEDEDGDEDAGPGGFSPFDRQGQGGDDFGDSGPQQPAFDGRGDGDRPQRFDRGGERFDRNEAPRQDRGDRQNRGDRQDRGDRPFDRNDRRDRFPPRNNDRPQRQDFQRPDGPRYEGSRSEGPRDDQGSRQDQGPRRDQAPRQDFNRDRDRRRDQEEPPREAPAGGLPAFLTNPVRPNLGLDEGEPSSAGETEAGAPDDVNGASANGAGYGARPRRRRRPRFEEGSSESGSESPSDAGEAPAAE